jgi:Tfp pilus assembly protein PilN
MRPVNLLPQDARRRPSGQLSGSAYVVVGVLGALLALVAGYVVVSNKVTSNENKAAAAGAAADRLEAQAQRKSAFSDFAAIKEQRLAAVGQVAATRFDWERFMRELARIMPERSWIQSADASVTGDPAAAGTPNPSAAAATGESAQPTANIVGCTPGQTDTATMMVRLRKLYRVTDVTLNDSSLDTLGQDAESSIDDCGKFYTFDLTVTFSPAPPATEAPRGATRVPASLGGGS